MPSCSTHIHAPAPDRPVAPWRRRKAASARAALLAIAVAAAGFTAYAAGPVASTTASPLADKQAQAAKLDAQVTRLEGRLSDLQERWRGARIELTELDSDIEGLEEDLAKTRRDLARARVRLRGRVVEMYRQGHVESQVLGVAEAGSFSEMFERIDAMQRVGAQDADILADVEALRAHIEDRETDLRTARTRQATAVRRAAASKREMADVVEQKQAALDSVNGEILAIMEAQRAAAAAAAEAASRRRAASIEAGEEPAPDVAVTEAAPTPDGDAAEPTQAGGDGGGSDDGGGDSPISVPLPPASGSAAAAASIAMGKIGATYVFGAAGPDTFDCSGLILWAFAQAGRPGLPHSSYALLGMGVSVPLDQAQVGDIVVTNGGGHAGIYVGGGSIVSAPRTGRTVAVEPMSYYSVVDIRRI